MMLLKARSWFLFVSVSLVSSVDVRQKRLGTPLPVVGGGDTNAIGSWNETSRRPLTVAVKIGDNQKPGYAYPLKKCQGDCDSHDDCELGLFCRQRYSNESVPGCTGLAANALDKVDICFDPDDRVVFNVTATNSNLTRIGNDGVPRAAFPLQKCQGDCDDDSECAGWLECFQREGPIIMSVPGCTGFALDESTDYCYDPYDDSQRGKFLKDKGSDWNPAKSYPLSLCEGDCDSDEDCEGALVCFQRNGEGPVPSCQGTGSFNTDYCIRPEDDVDSIPPAEGAFRLQLFWQRGVDWQYEFFKQEWCMRCQNITCTPLDLFYTYTCNGQSTWFQFANQTNQATNVRVALTDLCIEIDTFNDARLMTCNASNALQRFSPGRGNFNTKKFELRMESFCLAQDHHPKAGEQLFIQECNKTVYSRTNFWSKY